MAAAVPLQVVMWEAASMACMYAAYVAATFWVSRHDEPVRADAALHEVPQEEGVGERHAEISSTCRLGCCRQQHARSLLAVLLCKEKISGIAPAASCQGHAAHALSLLC